MAGQGIAHSSPAGVKVIDERRCLAKTHLNTATGARYKGVNVFCHSRIAGLVAMQLMVRLRHTPCTYGLSTSSEVGALVALHDVGKVSPGFQDKILRSVGLGFLPSVHNFCTNHAEVSMASLYGKGLEGNTISRLAGRHHGQLPSSLMDARAYAYGGIDWQIQRDKLTQRILRAFKVTESLLILKVTNDQERALSGLVCASDWIASGDSFTLNP